MLRHEGLSVRQSAFAKAYVYNIGNGAKSARDAGYSSKNGADTVQATRLLANDSVNRAIEKEVKKVLTASNLTREDVADMLIGEATSPKNAEGARVRAQELLGKTFAMFVDRQITNESESIDGRELVLRLAVETPAAAIGMAIDLCLLDTQMVEALEPINPDLALRMQKLIEAGAREPLDIAFDPTIDGP